ncbi:hypothetical protein BH20ACT24_BH20ACT24_16190 [soil metagenome]
MSDWDNTLPGRYYIIRKRFGDLPPHVIAEVVDWSYVEDWWFAKAVVLSRREALADGDYCGALTAWDQRTDSVYAEFQRRIEAQIEAEEKVGSLGGSLVATWMADKWRHIADELDEQDSKQQPRPFVDELEVLREADPHWATDLDNRELALLFAASGLAWAKRRAAAESERACWDQLSEAIAAAVRG